MEELRRQRLKEFFKDRPDLWKDIKAEVAIMLFSSECSLKSVACKSRDFYAGKCTAFQEVMNMEADYE
jgi:hypothetical protein